MDKYPFVSIIVPARNEEKVIKECIDSLLNLDYPKNKYEIIVADGMSTDKTREIVKGYGKKVKLILNKKINAAAGRNLGLKHARGKIIAFTDADCVVDKKWLKNLAKELKPNTVVGGANLPSKNTGYFSRAVSYALGTFFGSAGSAQSYVYKKKTEVKSVPNANAMYWKSDILKVGGYDERFTTGQDAELNYRLRKARVKFYFIPDAKVWPKMRATPLKFAKRMFQYGFARAQFMKKHKTPLNPIYAFTPIFSIFAILSPLLIYLKPVISMVWVAYVLAALLYGISTLKIRYLPTIMGVFLIEHFCYGLGFLYGLIVPLKP